MTRPIQTPLLSVKDLTIAFGRGARRNLAVQDLSYDLYPGETLAIVGESGSGKSVSSMALLGLLPPRAATIEDGSAMFDGRDLLHLTEGEIRGIRGDRITMIFQEPMTSLTPVLRIGLQLTEALVEHKGMSSAQAEARAKEMLELVGLDNPDRRLKQFPHELSGGMRQRVMIAMAMAADPAILIADEPTTALDVTVQAQILDLMRDLKTRFGTSIILITHDMGVVAEMADRVVVMNRGRKIEEGTVAQIFADPQEAYTKKLLDAVPRLGAFAAAAAPRSVVADPVAVSGRLLHTQGMNKTFRESGFFASKSGGTAAMQDVGFDLDAGETLALVGESGSGKSTTGRAVLRLLELDSGVIEIDGTDMRKLSTGGVRKARRQMQMIFQDPFASLNPRISAGRLVAEPMVIHGLCSGKEMEDRVEQLFLRVGLEADHIRRYPHEFSGGQRQRLSIARALSVNPKLIVADEPTSALDVSVQAQVLELMLELQQSLGLAYLFISHDMAVVEEVSHRVAVMRRGRIVEIGPRQAVLNDPRHPYTRALLAAVPVPDPERTRGALPVIDAANLPMGALAEVAPQHMVARP
ncbi:ABC transporter ATP-binding protein [Marinibacterium profundimaris]|uniref:Glutathione import ATP-binding protein GsiA n=1 Tax=Marinibacterium profundimaris TaxID=1679460 RepID=A0A225NQ93_9RHOB|nr:ABC transporter ATP-binding protein [Marinibacterium profundimaris]OWU74931.1 ABC transporter ATP-binding protein [Marinibacterium profundimaris]